MCRRARSNERCPTVFMMFACNTTPMSETLIWSAAGMTIGAVASIVALRSRHINKLRESDRTQAGQLLGWDYQRLETGFMVAGRHLGRRWEVVVSEGDSARWTTLTFGAPDMDIAQLIIARRGHAQGVPEGLRWQVGGRVRFRRLYDVLAADEKMLERIISPEIEDLLLRWPAQNQWLTRHWNNTRIWVCPHGVRITTDRALTNWTELQHLVLLGQTVALRNGLL